MMKLGLAILNSSFGQFDCSAPYAYLTHSPGSHYRVIEAELS